MNNVYQLLDSGNGKKLERFGRYVFSRPAAQAVWNPLLPEKTWNKADGTYSRKGAFRWETNVQGEWTATVAGIAFKLALTDFGHVGIFPEQKQQWEWLQERIAEAKKSRKEISVLNLFAYSGGATLACAKAGASVCHLDASKGMVAWARENAALNDMNKAPIRWIIDDVKKFLARELRRGNRYDGIILDPPSFGRGSQGQVFKFEEDLMPLMAECRKLLSDQPLFLLLSCHTDQITPLAMHHVLFQSVQGLKGKIEAGEMCLEGEEGVLPLPNGCFARWSCE